jgi:hypothetical protein
MVKRVSASPPRWRRTEAGATSNKPALFFGTLIRLAPGDDAVSLAAANRAASDAPVSPTGEERNRAAVQGAGMARRTMPAVDSKPAAVDPQEAATRLRRALAHAEHSPPWLPDWVAHADWGTALAKRAVALAELHDGSFRARAPSISGHSGRLLDDMGLHGRRGRTLLGFDFPIGLPRAYAAQAGADTYVGWLRSLRDDTTLFDVAQTSPTSRPRDRSSRRTSPPRAPGLRQSSAKRSASPPRKCCAAASTDITPATPPRRCSGVWAPAASVRRRSPDGATRCAPH